MRRGADVAKYKGWSFEAYDPGTKSSLGDNTACIGCHELQADNDYLFSDRSGF